MKTINIILLNVTLTLFSVGSISSQTPVIVKESFDYSEGELGSNGLSKNGWGSSWAEQGAGILMKVQGKNECPGDEGKSIISDNTEAVVGNYSWVSRNLDKTWVDEGNTLWVGFYVNIISKSVATWWGLQIANSGDEKIWLGTVNQTGVFGIHTKDNLNLTSEVEDAAGSKTWLVLKMEMNGDVSDTDAGKDSIFLFLNPDVATEPNNSSAVLSDATGALNAGFNQFNLGADKEYSMAFDRIILSDSYAGLGAVTSFIGDKLADKSFIVYPSVTKGKINMKFTMAKPSVIDLNIYSVTGQKVLTIANQKKVSGIKNMSIDLSSLSQGIYFLLMYDGYKYYNQKIVLSK